MHPQTEQEELRHLEEVQGKLQGVLDQVVTKINQYADEIEATKRYVYQNLAQLDAAEKAANRTAVFDAVTFGEQAVRERDRLLKLIQSPYFGRIDFSESTPAGPGPQEIFYIGVHSFVDPLTGHNLIFDWRAPVSSIFYDFETGPASYRAPLGEIHGRLARKRQYRIRRGELEYLIESSLNIGDEILQKELSRASDDRMKNIVATIQKEQNTIIRNETARVLILQGAAGSGKTSIALHRVAFLLYRYKETLSAQNMMILSPNKVFGSYISNVLPELGEENILEKGFEEIAAALLGKKHPFQTFAQQVESLLREEDPAAIERIQFKATNRFVTQLQAYLEEVEESAFIPADVAAGPFFVSGEQLHRDYHRLKQLPILPRLQRMTEDLLEKYHRTALETLDAAARRQVRTAIRQMYPYRDPLALYRQFYAHLGREDLLHTLDKKTLEYCDAFPLLLVKLHLEGVQWGYQDIRHLLVDEMQDYTPVQYAVLARLFSCKMTILGDSYQSVNPYSSSSVEKIKPYFAQCDTIELCKSYRSTVEITSFAQRILTNEKLIPLDRHGPAPTITPCESPAEQLRVIQDLLAQFRQSGHASLGILCKSQQGAKALFEAMHHNHPDITLLDFGSSQFAQGIILTSVHMSKGLEFDQVIVPGASRTEYRTPLDRSLLYIACTRAMHRLDLTYWGRPTVFLDPA